LCTNPFLAKNNDSKIPYTKKHHQLVLFYFFYKMYQHIKQQKHIMPLFLRTVFILKTTLNFISTSKRPVKALPLKF